MSNRMGVYSRGTITNEVIMLIKTVTAQTAPLYSCNVKL